ncbi:MAG: DNA-binding response regulator [Thiothrix nivea]|nr:MAG: DNA-binding response regulator [Thiothrix nivea]
MTKKILIIDDDSMLNDLLAAYFGEQYQVVQAFDGESGLARFAETAPDIILLDVMMPKMDGIEVLNTIRQTSQIPILMLTAKAEDVDKILGLESGADDYVAKPCNPRELAARINNLLTRTAATPAIDKDSPIILDKVRRQFRINGEALELTAAEYDILTVLYDNQLSIVAKAPLFEQVFHRELQPFDRTLDVHISNIRKKLIDTPVVIQTLRGKGYRLCPSEEA